MDWEAQSRASKGMPYMLPVLRIWPLAEACVHPAVPLSSIRCSSDSSVCLLGVPQVKTPRYYHPPAGCCHAASL